MAYRSPNSYARFVRTADTVNSPGATRVMGLIGTGLNYYEVYDEPVVRSHDKPYDVLDNPNVFEVISVSSKPVFNGRATSGNIVYNQGALEDFELKNEKYIAWSMLSDTVTEPVLVEGPNDGSKLFKNKITALVDPNIAHFVEDGEWLIEITYVHDTSGAYRVINNITKEVVGEYPVSKTANFNVIPGLKLTIDSTYIVNEENEVVTRVGDYVIITTEAGKTEKEAEVLATNEVVEGVEGTFKRAIKDLSIFNAKAVEDATYTITIKTVTDNIVDFSITKEDDDNYVYNAAVGQYEDYLDIIPGINFKFDNADGLVEGDKIDIVTQSRSLGRAPAEDSIYYVSYKYKKADEDYNPKLFFDYDDIINEYGNYDVTASGIVINSLALGAEIAFTNGVGMVVCVQAKNDSDYEMNKAIDLLRRELPGVNNINTIIPLTESAQVGIHAANHVELMSSYENGKERMVYLGAARNQPITKNASAMDRSLGMAETAKSLANERVVYVVPGEVIKDIRDIRTGRIIERRLPACYAAIGVAALGLINDPAEPLTNKNISGFKRLTNLLMDSEKNFLAEAGCLVLDQRGNSIRVRHGITTSNVSVNSTEITLVQIKDYVIDACRDATSSLYIGNKNRPSIVSDVEYTISSILDQFAAQEIIMGYTNLSVKRSKEDPRQIDVKFEIEAVYPLNYINISFGFAAVS